MKKSRYNSNLTFPISQSRLRIRLIGAVLLSPVTWIPGLIWLNGVLFYPERSTALIVAGLSIVSALILYWGIHWNRQKKKILKRLIFESNHNQNSELLDRADKLLTRNFNNYALALTNFVGLKRKIESAIHRGDGMTSRREEIDCLVDSIIFGAADQYEKMADIDERLHEKRSIPVPPDVEEHLTATCENIKIQLREALQLLEETWQNIGQWFDPSELPESQHESLDTAIAHLKQERDLVYKVRDRMDSDWASQFPETMREVQE